MLHFAKHTKKRLKLMGFMASNVGDSHDNKSGTDTPIVLPATKNVGTWRSPVSPVRSKYAELPQLRL